MSDEIDEALVEIDLLAVADAVGVLKGGPVELSPAEQWAMPLPGHKPYDDEHVSHLRRLSRTVWHDPYPPVVLTGEQARELANELVRLGFTTDYIAARYGLTPRKAS